MDNAVLSRLVSKTTAASSSADRSASLMEELIGGLSELEGEVTEQLSAVRELASELESDVASLGDAAVDAIDQLAEAAGEGGDTALPQAKSTIESHASSCESSYAEEQTALDGGTDHLRDAGFEALSAAVSAAASSYEGHGTEATGHFGEVNEALTEAAGVIDPAEDAAAERIKETTEPLENDLKERLKSTFDDAVNALREEGSGHSQAAQEIVSQGSEAYSSWTTSADGTVDDLIGGLKDKIDALVGEIDGLSQEAISGQCDQIEQGALPDASAALEALGNAVSEWAGATDGLDATADELKSADDARRRFLAEG